MKSRASALDMTRREKYKIACALAACLDIVGGPSHMATDRNEQGGHPLPASEILPVVQARRRGLAGLLVRKECWSLSGRGWLVLAVIILAGFWLFLTQVHSFLATTHRVPAKVLVVEGWVNKYGIDAAIQEFKTGEYEQVITTGGPLEGMGNSSSIYNTEAYQSAGLLKKAGLPPELVQCAPALFVGKDRTYNSALALRAWLKDHHLAVESFNVLTQDAHARRTWLLFREAFGRSAQIGIISAANPDYDASHWWRTSEGVRTVIDESIAYIYARCFFWPPSQ